ncbi:MAG: hypothetical protein KTR28_08080 [Micavibrio sp.]|nr:hypothetical protein [Micavibrio sp.]
MAQLDTLKETVNLPVPPETREEQDMEIYARFMRHLRCVPNSRSEIKVLSAVQFTADMLGCSDAHIARVLVDLGLRAPRAALPADYLRFADQCLMRSGWEVGGPSPALLDLREFWNEIGEARFASFHGDFAIYESAPLY